MASGSILARRVSLTAAGAMLRIIGDGAQAAGPPFPPTPGAGSLYLVGIAQGAGAAGQTMQTGTAPDTYTALTSDEAAVTNYEGVAVAAYVDGGPVTIWTGGPCPLFSGLNMSPVLPDTRELYVYGPGPPVPFSGVPADTYYRRAGSAINTTTINLSKGDVFKTPA